MRGIQKLILQKILFHWFPPGSLQGEHQRKLYKELLANYNRLERPVINDSAAILVELGFTLLQIIDVVRETALAFFTCVCVRVCVCMCWCRNCHKTSS